MTRPSRVDHAAVARVLAVANAKTGLFKGETKMPYDRTDPAAWWKDAEPMPPKPDEPACDASDARSPSTTPVVGSRSFTSIPNAPAWVPPAPPPEVRVGDRLLRVKPGAGEGETVRILAWEHGSWTALGENGIGAGVRFAMKPEYIGPPGSGRPWTLLPREAPLSSASRPLIATARVDAAHDVLRARAVGPVSWNAVCEAVRAADAADLRREALERVAEAARRCVYGSDQRLSRDYARLRAAVVALAALYGKRRP